MKSFLVDGREVETNQTADAGPPQSVPHGPPTVPVGQINLGPTARSWSRGTKWDDDKPAYGLLPVYGVELAAAVAKVGAVNYDDWNFTKGIPYSRLIAAAKRHIAAFERGEEVDPDNEIPPLGGAIWSLMALAEMSVIHPELDDRAPWAADPAPSMLAPKDRMTRAIAVVRETLKRVLPKIRAQRAAREASK